MKYIVLNDHDVALSLLLFSRLRALFEMPEASSQKKRESAPIYVPPGRRSQNPYIPDSSCKVIDPNSKFQNGLVQTGKSRTPLKNSRECSEFHRSSNDDCNSDQIGVLDSAFQNLKLNESFEDGGLVTYNDVKTEVVKVPVGASTANHTNPPPLKYEKYQHIIELYGFPADTDATVIEAALLSFKSTGFTIKWVDDTHCLAVFSSPIIAEQALKNISGPLIKVRPVENASVASKWKIAKSPGDWTMPYKKRPASDASVANRFISSHLGLPMPKPSPKLLQARKEAQGRPHYFCKYKSFSIIW